MVYAARPKCLTSVTCGKKLLELLVAFSLGSDEGSHPSCRIYTVDVESFVEQLRALLLEVSETML